MQRILALSLGSLLAACAAQPADEGPAPGGDNGKADGSGSGSGSGSGWTREAVSDHASLWNGGPTNWGAGTTIAIRADGQPQIAYYDATYRCNNGGWGTYSPDTLMMANLTATGWTRRIEVCGPENGYWPRMRVDDSDRTHILFGGGWFTNGQRGFYLRLDPMGQWETSKAIDSGSLWQGALALTLDDAGTPIMFSNGHLVDDMGTKTPVFADFTSNSFVEHDSTGVLHIVGDTMIPEPNDPNSSTARLRYARKDGSTVTIEVPRTVPVATPLGLVIDSMDQPHLLSWNPGASGGGELWHTVRTASGWVDELIASDVYEADGALSITADDELLVAAPGHFYRHAASATEWTSTTVPQLSSGKYFSMVIAPDGGIHVAFEVVGPTMSNRSAMATVYHASLHE
jgi:hypothetical protein